MLAPKFSVRRRISLDSQESYNHHMITFLQQEYLEAGDALVQVLKSGKSRVTKGSVKKRHPFVKDELAAFVRDHPEALERYKELKGAQGPLATGELEMFFDERVFARVLIERLTQIASGSEAASEYHSVATGICTFLFFPNLICPVKEQELHEGRKRIDIKFTNTAKDGFFRRMLAAPQTRAISVSVECKNYQKEINNPELDQLSGRFGHQRGFLDFCCVDRWMIGIG